MTASLTISIDSALAVLSKRGWFAERPAALQAALARIARPRRFVAGEPLYLYGDIANGIFGLVDGELDISIPRADGLDVTVHRADPASGLATSPSSSVRHGWFR